MVKILKNNKKFIRNAGIVLVSGLVIVLWWNGLFSIIFYTLGFYGAIYIISYLFKTTSVATFLLTMGGFILYIISVAIGLYLMYRGLKIMFGGEILLGLFVLFILSLFSQLLSLIPVAIGAVLGYPLLLIIDDLDKKFNERI